MNSDVLANDSVDDQFCQMCGKSSTKNPLSKVTADDSEEKELVMCNTCICLRNLSLLCVSESEKIRKDTGYETEIQINRRKEVRFRLYAYQQISESENLRVEEHDLINSAAEKINISPITARRYLDKICSSAGVLKRVDDGDSVYVEYSLKKEDFQ
ncbi:hypothetical protein [Nitrosopumilus maritimus]|nr:hypothetical protein [Nitrosopumilus maritimus]